MRIAIISTPYIPVPPLRYGGTELIVHELARGLRARGHEVLLYTVPAARDAPLPDGARALYDAPVWPPDLRHELNHSAFAVADLAAAGLPVDVIHTHCPISLPLARFARAPMVFTIHHDRSDELAAFYAMQAAMQATIRFVAISERQRRQFPELPRVEVVHHGLDPSRYPLGTGDGGAVFLGRLAREKSPHLAIEAARRAAVPIRVAGRSHLGDEAYFREQLAPRLRGEPGDEPAVPPAGVELIGEVDHAEKVSLLGQARALLFPIAWEEPFGLVMVEAMLCGTPVLAFRRGSVPEVVEEGVTGFLCDDVGEMAERLRQLSRHDGGGFFDRRRCRARAVERFHCDRMVGRYLGIYQAAIDAAQGPLPRSAARPSPSPTLPRDPKAPARAGADPHGDGDGLHGRSRG